MVTNDLFLKNDLIMKTITRADWRVELEKLKIKHRTFKNRNITIDLLCNGLVF